MLVQLTCTSYSRNGGTAPAAGDHGLSTQKILVIPNHNLKYAIGFVFGALPHLGERAPIEIMAPQTEILSTPVT